LGGKVRFQPSANPSRAIELALPEGKLKSNRLRYEGWKWCRGILFPIKLKEVFEAISDVVPGFSKFFKQRMQIMLSQNLIREIVD
jgi:hypothetical protein